MKASHEKRIQKLEQAIKARSRQSPECICFPADEPPFYGLTLELIMLTLLMCPLHGKRFGPLGLHVYVPQWMREKMPRLLWRRSAQYQKAWLATFPPDLWPGTEEEGEDGIIHLILKDGNRLLAEGPQPWSGKKIDPEKSNEMVFRGYVNYMKSRVLTPSTK